MARQKKIVPYVPNSKLIAREDLWKIVWDNRANHTLEGLVELAVKRDEYYKPYDEGAKAHFQYQFDRYLINADNWREDDGDGSPKKYGVRRLCGWVATMTTQFDEMNNDFLAEYDSREDLQEVYKKFYPESYGVSDRYGMQYWSNDGSFRNEYTAVKKTRQQIDDLYRNRPDSYLMFMEVVSGHNARTFIEINRPTPYEPGDIVKLRDPYIDHCDHDPLWQSRYAVARGATPAPDKSVERLATVMKVTDRVDGWRGSKGNKVLEVLWFGKTETSFVREKVVKWMQRPTKKNGLVK